MRPSCIASFVIRLYCAQPAGGELQPMRRVVVRHVQTGEERQFQQLAEALSFLEKFACGKPDTEDPTESGPFQS